MKTKTFKCVQCGECMVQADGKPLNDRKQSRTGCVLFHDQRMQRTVGQERPKGLFHQLRLLFDKKRLSRSCVCLRSRFSGILMRIFRGEGRIS